MALVHALLPPGFIHDVNAASRSPAEARTKVATWMDALRLVFPGSSNSSPRARHLVLARNLADNTDDYMSTCASDAYDDYLRTAFHSSQYGGPQFFTKCPCN